MAPKLLTVNEAAAFLGYSVAQMYVLCRAGKVPHYRIGGDPTPAVGKGKRRAYGGVIRFDVDELRAWLEASRQGPKVSVG